MRRQFAVLLNMLGSKSLDSGKVLIGERYYKFATRIDPSWSVPFYNLGLHFKNAGCWEESLRFNQRALELNPEDESACWNLGIAATALGNWTEARRAWKIYGIQLASDEGEVRMSPVTACVRLSPSQNGEVVWGQRIDPARIVVLNVPLPESGRRFHDIILNDGASDGTRADDDGGEVPVFNELSIWQVSEYSTFSARLQIPGREAEEHLTALCVANKLGIEDWSTVRMLCTQCSRGNPGPHECESKPLEGGSRRFGFGAVEKENLSAVLQEWAEANGGAGFMEPQLVLDARPI